MTSPEPAPHRTADGYTVAGLAARTGVTTSSVRYYLRQGLLRGSRDRRGQWVLEASSPGRVDFIRAAQRRDLSLPEIAALLDPDHGATNRADLAADADRRIAELRGWRDLLLADTATTHDADVADDRERVLCS